MRERRRVWQCKSCGAQTSVTAGTVMHNTQTPLQLWFWAAYLVATHHPGISAVQLVAAPARDLAARARVDDAAQAVACDGRPGARAAEA